MRNGLEDSIHGNNKRLPSHGFNTEELKTVATFLQNYAEENAILLPGRIPGLKRTDLQLLPTQTTKVMVWKCYVQACGPLTFRLAAYSTFCCIWRRYLPHIMITTPKTDLCWTCQQNSHEITATANKTDVKKSRVSNKLS